MDIVGRRRQENALAGLTLTAVLTNEPNRKHQTRTLFDIIQEDKGGKGSKKPWKSFKQKIKIRRAGSNWKSTVPIPACDVVVEHSGDQTITHAHSNRFADVPNVEDSDSNSDSDSESPRAKEPASGGLSNSRSMMLRGNSIRAPDRQPVRMMMRETVTDELADDEYEGIPAADEEEKENEEDEEEDEMAAMVGRPKEPRVKMSLMSLLAETDGEMGFDGGEYTEGAGEEEEEEEDEEDGGGGGGEYSNCCVCMVRHKGTPFVPCGHTFCRLCSKELYVQRGSCPICTNYILEILDIF